MGNFASCAAMFLIVGSVMAAEPPAAPDDGRSLHFRMEVGVENARSIDACLLEASGPGTGYDAALLDLDGDGDLETKRVFKETTHPRTKLRIRDNRIAIRHEGAIWTLEVDALKSPASATALVPGTTSVQWSVQSDGLYTTDIESLPAARRFHAAAPTQETGARHNFPNPRW